MWREETDLLRCTPKFFGQPRYDGAISQTASDEFMIVRLMFVFCLHVGDMIYALGMVQPMQTPARVSAKRQEIDRELGFCRVKELARVRPTFIPLRSLKRGVLLYPEPVQYKEPEHIVVDTIGTGDMFIWLKSIFPDRVMAAPQ